MTLPIVSNLQFNVKGKRVVEIGCGCGLVSICCVLLGASFVLATDTVDAMSLVEKNASSALAPIEQTRFRAQPLHWGEMGQIKYVML